MRTLFTTSAMCAMAVIQFSCGTSGLSSLQKLPGSSVPASSYMQEAVHTSLTPVTSIHTTGEKPIVTRMERFTQPVDDFEKPVERSAIVSPSPQDDVPYQEYTIDAATGATLTYDKTGSTIYIPQDALVDEQGNPVNGNVDITYREFHTQKDVFFSGIPMDFEVNGEQQFFETAGMIDINATQNHQQVFVKKGKQIRFKMSTDNTNEEVNLYELDTKTKKWKQKGKAPVTYTPYKPQKVWGPVYVYKTQKVKKRAPLYLEVTNYYTDSKTDDKIQKRKVQFRFSILQNRKLKSKENRNSFKAARIINMATFEVSGYRKRQFIKTINQFNEVDKQSKSRRYQPITGEVEIVEAEYPFVTFQFSNNGITELIKTKISYNGIHKKFGRKYFNQIQDFDFNQFEGRNFLVNTAVNVIDHFDSVEVYVDSNYLNKSLVQREFCAMDFGILNCDQPKALPDERVANVHFTVDDAEINPSYAVLVDFGRKCQFTYYDYAFSKFGFDPSAKNFVFTICPNGNVAYILPEDFKNLEKEKALTIPLHMIKINELATLMEKMFPSKTQPDYMI